MLLIIKYTNSFIQDLEELLPRQAGRLDHARHSQLRQEYHDS
jgi:hypothetical protein